MNRLRGLIKDKFHIIDEPQQEAGEFIMKIAVILLHELGTRQTTDDSLQCCLGTGQTLLIPIGRDPAALIRPLRGYAIRTRRARRK